LALRKKHTWFIRFWSLFTILLLLAVVFQLGIYFREKNLWASEPDIELFQKICGQCHNFERAHNYAKSPQEWAKTVDRMWAKDEDLFDEKASGKIKALLIRRRSSNGVVLFDSRCGRCHSKQNVMPYLDLAPDALALLVRQHIKQNNFVIQIWEGELILEHLLAVKGERPEPKSTTSAYNQLLFQKNCGACHTAGFLYRTICREPKNEQQWTAIIERMIEKSPDLFQEGNLKPLVEHVTSICTSGNPAP